MNTVLLNPMQMHVTSLWIGALLLLALLCPASPAAPPPLYTNDFEHATLDAVPEDFLVLNGAFEVKQDGANKFLELPGAPLESYGLLFGPTDKDGLAVSARIFATSKGRRYPAFAVGLNGVGGHRLQVSPAKKQLELCKGDEVVASVPYRWKTEVWTCLRLQIRPLKSGAWQIEGRVWGEGKPEPEQWLIACTDNKEPYPGRASVWGKPFSGTPIRFDDFQVNAANAPPGN